MSFRDALARAFSTKAARPPIPAGYLNMVRPGLTYDPVDSEIVLGMGPAELWRTQPYLRMVVSFIARNVAQLGLHAFRRVGDTDRERLQTHPVALLVRRPNDTTTTYELLYQLISDLAVYDRAYLYLGADGGAPSGYSLTRIPPSWVYGTNGGDLFAPASFSVRATVPYAGTSDTEIPASDLLYFHGWHPYDPRLGASPVEALKQILAEQIHASAYRDQAWRRGGRASAVLTRPADAPPWSDPAKERFRTEWSTQWAGDGGSRAGGTPILEDGMTLQRLGFSANEDQFVDNAKLALNVVAAVYHVNPTMIGLLDNANYSNVREFRRMLYGDTLGPLLAQVEDRLNSFLLPRLPDSEDVYVEFNIGEKLQGSFEEQTAALQSAVGRPWMTADEARAKLNMPALGGEAASLVVPLNVLIGGQASPTDSGTQNLRPAASDPQRAVKARAPQAHEDAHADLVRKFFSRQERVVRGQLGVKADAAWWDGARWNAELAADLFAFAEEVSRHTAAATLDRLGVSPDRYDVARTLAYLKAVAESDAANINESTREAIEAALATDDPASNVADVFTRAKDHRAAGIAAVAITRASAFGTVESAKQVAGTRARKTWITGPKPRPSHAAMSGETVPVDEPFSNGMQWPGDSGDATEVSGCNCDITVTVA